MGSFNTYTLIIYRSGAWQKESDDRSIYLGIKWEIMKTIIAMKLLAIGLIYGELVSCSWEYLNLICKLHSTSLKVTFTANENSTPNTIYFYSFIVICIFENYVRDPERPQLFIRERVETFSFLEVVIVNSVGEIA